MSEKLSNDAIKENTDFDVGKMRAADLLQQASRGLALQGIYLTAKPEDLMAERRRLVDVPMGTGPFAPLVQRKDFRSTDALCVEPAALTRTDFGVLMPACEQPHCLKERQANVLHLAPVTLAENELCLSEDALRSLKDISEQLGSLCKEEIAKKVIAFFRDFGSHAVAGHVSAGKVDCRDVPSQETDETEGDNIGKQQISDSCFCGQKNGNSEKDGKNAEESKSETSEYDMLNEHETSQYSKYDNEYANKNKNDCGKLNWVGNTNNKSSMPGNDASENEKQKETENAEEEKRDDNEKQEKTIKNKKVNNEVNFATTPKAYSVATERDNETKGRWVNPQETTSETLGESDKNVLLVSVWSLVTCAHSKDFPNATLLAIELRCVYYMVTSLTPDRPILRSAATDTASYAFSALQNWDVDNNDADANGLKNLQQQLCSLTGKNCAWQTVCSAVEQLQKGPSTVSFASIASLVSMLVLCTAPATEDQHLFSDNQRIALQVPVECPEPQADETSIGAHTLQPHEEETVSDVVKTVDTLMLRLQLKQWYPKGFGQSQFRAVSYRQKVENDEQAVPVSELVSHFIQMLRTADYNILCLGYSKEEEDEKEEEYTESSAENEGPVHPMDLLLCFFLCADDFMRQEMFERLSTAQVALPFLVPVPHSAGVEMPLWSFRKVLKSVLSATKSGLMIHKDLSVCKITFPFVCFVRYGQSQLSKSRFANGVLNKGKHNVFFNSECTNSTQSRMLADGLAEIYWYYPRGRETKTLTAFVNLRGDAVTHSQQAAYLYDIAAVFVIFCTEQNKEKVDPAVLQNQRKIPVIWVSPDMRLPKKENETVIQCNAYIAEKVNKLRVCIQKAVDLSSTLFSLEDCAARGKESHKIIVDDGGDECAEGKKHAETVFKFVKSANTQDAKEKLLPCLEDWQNLWCKMDINSTQLKEKAGKSIMDYQSEIEENKKRIRCSQAEKAKDNGFMNAFVGKLRTSSPKKRLFFLRWMNMMLNEHSSECLADLRAEFIDIKEQLLQNRAKEGICSEQELKTKLYILSQEMDACTFGLEHCMREVAQMYEAMRALNREDCNDLPRIAADLLRRGEPLELMNGDVSYVPVDWVKAVLGELHAALGEEKVFVLSVLGNQSSGKSTLLNTMFGLRFAVSAGRCTRGAFMQLVEIAEECKSEFGFDYILVIDTEGLRSTELSDNCQVEHDNRMATFVIGLANMTLINIYGENLSDVKDFLEITVHAFLRMDQVKLSASCLFVHQNVSDATAKEKNAVAAYKMNAQLDEMTAEVAKQEGIHKERFNEVIKNDVQTFYFCGLFYGDPPMAPLNPSYGTSASEVRNAILEFAKQKSAEGVLSISHFSTRVNDLWAAVRGEKFVFSFKNTVELRVHGKLETKRCELERKMRFEFVPLIKMLCNNVEKGELTTVSERHVKEDSKVRQLKESIDAQCEEFFQNDKEKSMLIKWHEETKNYLYRVFDDIVAEAVVETKKKIRLKECRRDVDLLVKKAEEEIILKTKTLARDNKGKVTEQEGKKLFDDLFETYLKKIDRLAPESRRVNVRCDAENVLIRYFSNVSHVAEKVSKMSGTGTFTADPSKRLQHNFFKKLKNWVFKNDDKFYIQSTFENLENTVSEYVKKKKENDYSKEYFEDIFNIVSSEVEKLNSTNVDKGPKLTTNFLFDVLLHIFGQWIGCFDQMHKTFEEVNHPVFLLEKKRNDLYQHFTAAYGDASEMMLFAKCKSEKIMREYRNTILNKVVENVVSGMTSKIAAFSGNKSKLEAHIYVDLVERGDIEDYLKNIRNTKEYYENYISRQVSEYCGKGCLSCLQEIIRNTVEHYHGLICRYMEDSTTKVKGVGGDADAWLNALYKKIKNSVSFSVHDLKEAMPANAGSKVDFFQEEMLTAWKKVDRELFTVKMSSKTRNEIVDRVVEYLIKEKCGCLETCPFCRAVCCNTMAGHTGDHFVVFHRPEAIGGYRYIYINEASIDICSCSVSSDARFYNCDKKPWILFKEYRTAGPPFDKWSITPDSSFPEFWKYFVCQFRNELTAHYGYKFEGKGEIPSAWKRVTKKEAIKSMKDYL